MTNFISQIIRAFIIFPRLTRFLILFAVVGLIGFGLFLIISVAALEASPIPLYVTLLILLILMCVVMVGGAIILLFDPPLLARKRKPKEKTNSTIISSTRTRHF